MFMQGLCLCLWRSLRRWKSRNHISQWE